MSEYGLSSVIARQIVLPCLMLSICLAGCGDATKAEPESIDYTKIPQQERQEFRYFKVGEDWYKFPEYSITHFKNLTPLIQTPRTSSDYDPRILISDVMYNKIGGRVWPRHHFFSANSKKQDLYEVFWNTSIVYDVDHKAVAGAGGLYGCREKYIAAYETGRLEDYLKEHSEHFYSLTWHGKNARCFLTKKAVYFNLPILMGSNTTYNRFSDEESVPSNVIYRSPSFSAFDPSREFGDVSFPPAFRLQLDPKIGGEADAVIEKLPFFEDYLKLIHIGPELPQEVRKSIGLKNE